MRAPPVGKPEKEELDGHVRRILRDLDNPEPPLNLDDVRSILNLDKEYYSTADESCFQDFVHYIRMGARQVLEKPSRLGDAIRQFKLSALWIPHSKTILIDSAVPVAKHRWSEGHEIAHSLASWHQDFLLGDNESTLVHSCHETLEAEANYGSGQLLFMGSRFASEARDLSPSMASILELAKRFGNSKTSTLWRYVEQAFPERPYVGLVLIPPHKSRTGGLQCKHVIETEAFKLQFHEISGEIFAPRVFEMLAPKHGGPLGGGQIPLVDRNRKTRRYLFEGWSNHHEILVLGLPD